MSTVSMVEYTATAGVPCTAYLPIDEHARFLEF
jgi:hypothetical protein